MTAQVVLHDLAVEDFQQTWGAPFKYLISSEVNPNCLFLYETLHAHLLVAVQLSSSSDPLLHLGYMNVNKESPEYDGASMFYHYDSGENTFSPLRS